MSSRLLSNSYRRRRLFRLKRNELKKRTTVTSAVDVIRLLEQLHSDKGGGLEDKEAIVSCLNDLCRAIDDVKDLSSQANFYDILCRRVARYMLSDVSSIRASTYRILRKASQFPSDLSTMLYMHLDIFVIRSMELDVGNVDERIEALKLCALMLNYNNEKTNNRGDVVMGTGDASDSVFPKNICRTLIAIATTHFPAQPGKPKVVEDELAFSCVALIAEQAVVSPDLILDAVGTGWVTELLTSAVLSERLSAFICQILCAWLDSPRLRARAKLRLVLEQIFAPVIEIGLFHRVESKELQQQSMEILQLQSFSQTLLNLLRTWSGLFACSTYDDKRKMLISSPLRFFEYMGVSRNVNPNRHKIRDLVIECCCELLDLSYSQKKFYSWLEAVQFYSTVHHPDAYKCSVRDEFVLVEHEMLLRISQHESTTNDLLVSYRAVVIYMLINAGLVQSLSRLILHDPDDPTSLKATLLMSDLLLAGSIYLPIDWKLRVLSVPALVHSACEAVSEPLKQRKPRVGVVDNDDSAIFTYSDSRNAPLLLHRLDVLNDLALTRKTQPVPVTNLQLFVPSSPDAVRSRISNLAKSNVTSSDEDTDVEMKLSELLFKATDSDGKLCWAVVDVLLQLVEVENSFKDPPIKHSEKCYSILKQIFTFITPSEGLLVTKFDGDRFMIACCCRAIHVSLLFAAKEAHYRELLMSFINDFMKNISEDVRDTGPLSPKNLLNTGALYYFAFIGAITADGEGRRILEATPLLQMFVDLVKKTSNVVYIKLVVSCLDYSADDSFARVILHTALTSSIEAGRKWTTRFLGILASHGVDNFVDWGMKLMLAQLADPSAKVVRHTFRLLHRWIPHYPKSVYLIRDIRFDTFGDAGTLLQAHLFADDSYVKSSFREALTVLDFWKKEFNMRYVEIIDEDVKVALLNSKRSLNGQFARASNERNAKYGVPMPVHLYGQLAQHETGRDLLLKSGEVRRLLDMLRDWPLLTDAYEICELKGALYALGHIVATVDYGFLPLETVPIICRFAECCPILSIRGTACWVMNLIGSTQHGASLLSSLGWESSKFGTFRSDTNNLVLKSPRKDISKTWIRCIDGKDSLRNETDLRDEEAADIGHKDSGFANDKRQPASFSEVANTFDELLSRSRRTFTVESSNTSGLGSVPKDDLDFGQLWSGELSWPHGVRRLSENTAYGPLGRLFSRGSVSTTETKGKELQNCLTIRSQFRLPPFAFDRTLTVERCNGGPITYQFMSEDEFACYRNFRSLFPDSGRRETSGELNHAAVVLQPIATSGQSISLPRHPDLLCKDIFVDEFAEHAWKSSTNERRHHANSCLYCSWPEEYFGKKGVAEIKIGVETRDEITSLFELLGSKRPTNVKKLLKRRKIGREVFGSLCLYSDIARLFAECHFTLETRRLMQELFADALHKFGS